LGDELVGVGEVGENRSGFFGGEDGGEIARGTGAECVDAVFQRDFEDVAIEEEEGAIGLVLGGGGNFVLDGEMGEEGFDFGYAHILGMAFVMEEDETPDPLDVGFFGLIGVVFEPEGFTDAIEKFFGLGFEDGFGGGLHDVLWMK
jgi:hypothetical protein